ncbi:hypothetical protein WSM22_26810 [Cytophagales bacterium WSM2-2]|nr:hypothetical protein WSM22_26810 [Cytophagales bacterium WSM2-2]
MKTKLAVLSLLISVTAAFAKVEPSVSVIAGSASHIFKVVYKSEATSKVSISIFDKNDEMVFTETINDLNEFIRPYNFSSLPEGEYTIEVKDNTGKKVEKVKYSQGTIESIIAVRKLTSVSNKYMLTSVNKGLNVLTISIFNEDGDLLHNETRMVDGNFGVVYSLTGEGKYTFVVADKTGMSKTINN